MSSVLAPVVTQAIAQQIQNSPHEVADVLAPEMAAAIRKQVKLKSEAMVDALYPVIGSTISTAIAETMREINTKVEKAFSPEAITRKIRARIQGVSDAELLLAETMPFKVRAIFLIHKSTGLLIAEVQQSGQQALEPEMIAGMLTAIRSFVGEYLSQSDHTSEIDEINYGNSKISLEVAGSCYLATVIDGEPTKAYRRQLLKTFSQIIQDHGDVIEVYTGDPKTIPEDITLALQNTITIASEPLRKRPPMLAVLASLLLGAIAIPWGIGFYNNQVEAKVEKALFATPELSVYPLEAQVGLRRLKLAGRVPDEALRNQAEKIANSVVPSLAIENNIISVELPQLPNQVAVNVATVQTIFNQREDININAQYQGDRVEVTGSVLYPRDLKDVSQTFAQVPGVKSVINSVQVKPLTLPIKVYFRSYSSQLEEIDLTAKISPIKEILNIYPDTKVTIFGYSDPDQETSVDLALERAQAAKSALENMGINSSRLGVRGENGLPPKVSENESNWLRRTAIVTLTAR